MRSLTALCMCIIRYSLDHGLFCSVSIYKLHLGKSWGVVRGYVMLCLLLWLLCQPEENKHVCRSHGLSRLLPAFQPLSSCLAYPGFSEQCPQYEQQDNWHCEQDEEQNTGKEEDGPFCPQKGLKKWYGHVKNTEAMLKRIHWPNKRQFKYQNN